MPSILANPLVSSGGDISALEVRMTDAEDRITVLEAGGVTPTPTYLTFSDSPYTVLSSDTFLVCNCTGGAITVNLRAVATAGTLVVTKSDASGNAVILDGNGSETVDEDLTFLLTTRNAELRLIPEPSNNKYLIDA